MKILVIGKHNLMNWPETVYSVLSASHDCRLLIANKFSLASYLLPRKGRYWCRAHSMAKQIAAFQPDIIFCISPFLLPFSLLKTCRAASSARFVGWVADNFASTDERAPLFDALFCTDTGFLPQALEICPSFYLPLCANTDIFYPGSEPATEAPFFVGQANKKRIRYLKRSKTPCLIYGKGWDKQALSQHQVHNTKLSLQEAAIHVQKSTCPFSMAFSSNNVNGLNFRVFELGAAKKVILTNYSNDLERCYHIGTEALTYKNPAELSCLVSRITHNPAKYEKIAQAGYERTLRDHTYQRRLQQWLDIMQKL